MNHEKAAIVWEGEPGYVAKNFVKIILNLIVLANASISRGGEIKVVIESIDPPRATVRATGDRIRIQPRLMAPLNGDVAQEAMDAQTIQPYYTLFLAQESGLTVAHEKTEGSVLFTVA